MREKFVVIEPGENFINGAINVTRNMVQYKPLPENTQVVMGSFDNLTPLFQIGTIDKMVFVPPLNTISPKDIVNVLMHWNGLLKSGGELTITFCDIRKLAKAIHFGELEMEVTHGMIFGPHNDFKSLFDTQITKDLVSGLGFFAESIVPDYLFVTMQLRKIGDAK